MNATRKIKIDGKIWFDLPTSPESYISIWENLIGKSWADKGGDEIKILFCGEGLTYQEWREGQMRKNKINLFGAFATLEDGEGNILRSFPLDVGNWSRSEAVKNLIKEIEEDKLSVWIKKRLDKSLFCDRDVYSKLLALALEEEKKGN